jgi:hypothetical protein
VYPEIQKRFQLEKLDERLIEMRYFPREYSLPRTVDDDGSSEIDLGREFVCSAVKTGLVVECFLCVPPTAISDIDHCMDARKALS